MPAVVADVLRVALAVRDEADPVRPEEAEQRMADLAFAARVFQEAVPAVARVLDEALARRDRGDAVPEQAARIPYLLREARFALEPIAAGRKHQRVAAAYADVLVHASPVGQPHVGVMTEETRQRVPDVRRPAVLGQVLDAAPAASHGAGRPAEDGVVDHVAPDPAAEAHPQRSGGWTVHAS